MDNEARSTDEEEESRDGEKEATDDEESSKDDVESSKDAEESQIRSSKAHNLLKGEEGRDSAKGKAIEIESSYWVSIYMYQTKKGVRASPKSSHRHTGSHKGLGACDLIRGFPNTEISRLRQVQA